MARGHHGHFRGRFHGGYSHYRGFRANGSTINFICMTNPEKCCTTFEQAPLTFRKFITVFTILNMILLFTGAYGYRQNYNKYNPWFGKLPMNVSAAYCGQFAIATISITSMTIIMILIRQPKEHAVAIQILTIFHFIYAIVLIILCSIAATFVTSQLYSSYTTLREYDCEKYGDQLYGIEAYGIWEYKEAIDVTNIQSVNAYFQIYKTEEKFQCAGLCTKSSTYKYYNSTTNLPLDTCFNAIKSKVTAQVPIILIPGIAVAVLNIIFCIVGCCCCSNYLKGKNAFKAMFGTALNAYKELLKKGQPFNSQQIGLYLLQIVAEIGTLTTDKQAEENKLKKPENQPRAQEINNAIAQFQLNLIQAEYQFYYFSQIANNPSLCPGISTNPSQSGVVMIPSYQYKFFNPSDPTQMLNYNNYIMSQQVQQLNTLQIPNIPAIPYNQPNNFQVGQPYNGSQPYQMQPNAQGLQMQGIMPVFQGQFNNQPLQGQFNNQLSPGQFNNQPLQGQLNNQGYQQMV